MLGKPSSIRPHTPPQQWLPQQWLAGARGGPGLAWGSGMPFKQPRELKLWYKDLE